MNFSRCRGLARSPLTSTWYRAIPPQHWRSSLKTSQTRAIRSRFSPGRDAKQPFEILYLSESYNLALFEVEAQFRMQNGLVLTNPKRPWLAINVEVVLQEVVDLTDPASHTVLDTSVQELTGDWSGYSGRQPHSTVPHPVGIAPTQKLGEALFGVPGIEGFRWVSSKLSDHANLAIFPQKLQKGSRLRFLNPMSNKAHVIAG